MHYPGVPILRVPCVAGLGAAQGSERKTPLATPQLSRAGARRAGSIAKRADVSGRPDPAKRPPAKEIIGLVLARLDDMKAEDTVTIDLVGKSSIADALIVTSGRSNRHVGSIADRVLEDLTKSGVRGARVEGMPHCDWVLIDAGDVIVHVFQPEVRAFYNLEKMWAPGTVAGRRAS
ncbi:MAG: ribosome silencing factor [Hyphomicrobiales bacterium]|nr:ribosome silencing factor [Hyphomicrobiales bacterium]